MNRSSSHGHGPGAWPSDAASHKPRRWRWPSGSADARHRRFGAIMDPVREPVTIDETFGDVVPLRFAEELRRGDWRSGRYVINELGDGDLRRAVDSRRVPGPPPLEGVQAWATALPNDGLGQLMLGTALIDLAWTNLVRAAAVPLADAMFRDRLNQAEAALWRAVELLPNAAEPWDGLLWTGIGLELDATELSFRYDCGHERAPFDPDLTGTALQMLSPKWLGDNEAMFGFAREITEQAPVASAAHATLAMAYVEQVAELRQGHDPDRAAEILASSQAGRELRAAADRSIFSPTFVTNAAGLRAANAFMVAFFLGGHHQNTFAVLDMLKGRYCARPFAYFGDPARLCRLAEQETAKALGVPVLAAARSALLSDEPVFTWDRNLLPRG